MISPTERAARSYIAVWQEADAAARARLLEACFAEDGRLVTPGTVIRGRAALARAIEDFRARGLTARLVGELDVQGPVFRFRSAFDRADGSSGHGFDCGEVDGDGRILTLLTFSEPAG